jgi:hypothetical protein
MEGGAGGEGETSGGTGIVGNLGFDEDDVHGWTGGSMKRRDPRSKIGSPKKADPCGSALF